MRKNLVNAIRLPSSNKIFGHDDDSFDERVLCSLLEEAHKRKLPNKTKIIITEEYFPDNLPVPEDADLRLYLKTKKSATTFVELKELYKKYYHGDYFLESLKKQGEKTWAWLPYQVSLKQNS